MNIYVLIINLIFTISCIYGRSSGDNGECETVNKLLGKDPFYNCCLETGVTCSNGHITKV